MTLKHFSALELPPGAELGPPSEERLYRNGDTSWIFRPDPIWPVARALYEQMEFLDPGDGKEWGDLSLRTREFYYFSVARLLQNRGDMLRAMRAANHN